MFIPLIQIKPIYYKTRKIECIYYFIIILTNIGCDVIIVFGFI